MNLDARFIQGLAAQLTAHWRRRLQSTRGRCRIGITVRPNWDPQKPADPVLHTAEALLREGAMPELLYLGAGQPEEQLRGLYGLVVPGGEEVHPLFYGQRPADSSEFDPAFDAFELTCVKLVFEKDLPFLGTCRGQQVLNVASGGTLKPVPLSRIQHRPVGGDVLLNGMLEHEVETVEDSRIEQAVGADPIVNTAHEQAIDQVGRGLVVTARAPDEVVEGMQRAGHPWQAAYQFHPELDRRLQGLFTRLVEDAIRRR